MQRTDKLAVSVYAKHGDCCSNAPHCQALGCASGFASEDFVLVAKFAYLQEAIDYCQQGTSRGVNMRLVSRICKPLFVRDYAPQPKPLQRGTDEWFEARNLSDDARDKESA